MRINRLASAISRGKWLIEPRTAMIERRRAVSFLKGDFDNIETKEPELDKPFAISINCETKTASYFDWSDDDDFELAQIGSVAIIPISGTIMKYDYCGSPGTDTLSNWLKQAIASPQIDAIVLLINSGGGSVEGTGEFADLIKASTKTILTFCEGLMASAAYWIGCGAKEVWASHATAEFGSIGTAVCFVDDSKYMEEMGFNEVYINADSSPDKNQDVLKAIDGDTTGIKENIINPTNAIFTAFVSGSRNLKLSGDGEYKEPLTGKVYLAETAIKNGLIDGICTLEQCIERAVELKTTLNGKTNTGLNQNSIQTLNSNTMNIEQANKSKTFLEKIKALFAEETATELTAEEIEAKKKADDEEEAKKKEDDTTAKKSDDMNDDNNDGSDENDVEVNGTTIRVNKAAKAVIEQLVASANKEIADRDALLTEAEALIAENAVELQKSDHEVRQTIKSSFMLKSSKRADRVGVTEKTIGGDTGSAIMPKKGSYAEQKLMSATSKAAAEAKEMTSRFAKN